MAHVYERFRNIYQPSFYNEFCRKCNKLGIDKLLLLQLIKSPTDKSLFKRFVISTKSLEQMMKITKWLKTTQKYTQIDMNDIAKRMMDNIGIDKIFGVNFDNYDAILFSHNMIENDYKFNTEIAFYVSKYKLDKIMMLLLNCVQYHGTVEKYQQFNISMLPFYLKLCKYPQNKNIVREILQFWHVKPIGCIKSIMQKSQIMHPTCNGDILFADEYIVKNIVMFL
jgi:hypothetical protein